MFACLSNKAGYSNPYHEYVFSYYRAAGIHPRLPRHSQVFRTSPNASSRMSLLPGGDAMVVFLTASIKTNNALIIG